MLYAINSNDDTRTLHYVRLIESYPSNCLLKYTENHDNDSNDNNHFNNSLQFYIICCRSNWNFALKFGAYLTIFSSISMISHDNSTQKKLMIEILRCNWTTRHRQRKRSVILKVGLTTNRCRTIVKHSPTCVRGHNPKAVSSRCTGVNYPICIWSDVQVGVNLTIPGSMSTCRRIPSWNHVW